MPIHIHLLPYRPLNIPGPLFPTDELFHGYNGVLEEFNIESRT
jgi:hypothetical protein